MSNDILAFLAEAIQKRELATTSLYGPQVWDHADWDQLKDTPHLAQHHPNDVLRRCAADRKLINLHGGRAHSCPAIDSDGDHDDQARFYNHETCPVVRNLAEGYGWTEGER